MLFVWTVTWCFSGALVGSLLTSDFWQLRVLRRARPMSADSARRIMTISVIFGPLTLLFALQ